MLRFSWLAIVVLLCPAFLLYSAEQKPTPSEQKIKTLLDRLVSPNPQPITGDEDRSVAPGVRLPPGFDNPKQEKVHRARLQLEKFGSQAFPMLIERWDDKRYSLTVSNMLSGYYHNYTVGKVCQTMIYDHIQPYGYWQASRGDPRGKRTRPQYPEKFLGSKAAAQEWWEKHKDKSLDKIQLEAIDWVIAEEAKEPEKFSDAERKRLQQIREKLTTDKKPLPPRNYYCNDIEK